MCIFFCFSRCIIWWFKEYLHKRSKFLLQTLAPPDTTLLVCSLPAKSTKRLARDVIICNFCHSSQSCLWHHWHRLLGTKWQHSWSCFCDFHIDWDQKLSEIQPCVFFSSLSLSVSFWFCLSFLYFYPIPLDRACDASSVQPPFKGLGRVIR